MFDYETEASAGREAERVMTAFYRFLEVRQPPQDADASVRREIREGRQHCVVRLWSEAAVRDFQRYLNDFSTPMPGGMPREFGAEA